MQGVEFEQVHVNISDSYKAMYDAAAALWLEVKEAIDHCKDSELISGTLAKVLSICIVHCAHGQIGKHDCILYSIVCSLQAEAGVFHFQPQSTMVD